MKTLPIGTLATDLSDLRQIFLFCLEMLDSVSPGICAKIRKKNVTKLVQSDKVLSPLELVAVQNAIISIKRDINKHSPLYTFFGAHPANYTQYGVWIDLDALHAAENAGIVSQASGDWKGVKTTYVLDIGKDGLILYRRKGRKIIWEMK